MTTKEIDSAIAAIVGKDAPYSSCLNAMHEAEKTLDSRERCRYATLIRSIHSNPGLLWFDIMHAPAAQRAHAFLSVHNAEVCGERSSRAPDRNAGRARSQ